MLLLDRTSKTDPTKDGQVRPNPKKEVAQESMGSPPRARRVR